MLTNTAARRRRQTLNVAHRLTAPVVALLFLLPLLWAAAASLRATGVSALHKFEWLPAPIAWENYRTVSQLVDLDRFALNTLFVAALAVPLTIVVASWAGFAISQFSQRCRLRLTTFSVLCLMVPLTAIWLPRFILFKQTGLINERLALVVPSLMGTSPLYVLLFTWTFMRVPREVYEAARLDGAGPLRVWAQIALPLARSMTVSVAVLAFVHYWNSFIEPLLHMRTEDKMTASLGLRVLYSLDRTNWPLLMTGAVLMMTPVVIVFFLAQRAFMQDSRGHSILGK